MSEDKVRFTLVTVVGILGSTKKIEITAASTSLYDLRMFAQHALNMEPQYFDKLVEKSCLNITPKEEKNNGS